MTTKEDIRLYIEELRSIALHLEQSLDKQEELSKQQAYSYLGISRATFDSYILQGILPKGKKIEGFKELRWTKYDLDIFINNKDLK
jgi:predicted DNA-binding transcriptional regulator AlpA